MQTINRLHRDVLAECIRQYFVRDSHPKETNEILSSIWLSDDDTVRYVLQAWGDFLEDYFDASPWKVPKSEWDLFQRYLLVLKSDRHIHCGRRFHWSRWQWVAGAATILFVGCGFIFGFVTALFWLGIPLSVLSVLISRAFRQKVSPYDQIVCPFDSFGSLSRTYDEVETFRKLRHPQPPRPIQLPRFVIKAIETKLLFFWLVVFPTIIFLPFQMLPRVEATTRIE